jgi:ABC-type uncharacterized transport system ATPase component
MKITKRQLKRLIKEAIIKENRFAATDRNANPAYRPGISAEEDEFGHLITTLGNQIYTQLDEMEQMLSGKEKNDYMRARSTFWKITKNAMESEEQK